MSFIFSFAIKPHVEEAQQYGCLEKMIQYCKLLVKIPVIPTLKFTFARPTLNGLLIGSPNSGKGCISIGTDWEPMWMLSRRETSECLCEFTAATLLEWPAGDHQANWERVSAEQSVRFPDENGLIVLNCNDCTRWWHLLKCANLSPCSRAHLSVGLRVAPDRSGQPRSPRPPSHNGRNCYIMISLPVIRGSWRLQFVI